MGIGAGGFAEGRGIGLAVDGGRLREARRTPPVLDRIADVVLAYRPKMKKANLRVVG